MATQPTSLRAIDIPIPSTEDHSDIHEWFYDHEAMLMYLAEMQMFADTHGVIKDYSGTGVGIWYFAEFSAKYPPEINKSEAKAHVLYKQSDMVPESWRDQNGRLTLDVCKACGLAEQELIDNPVCPPYKPADTMSVEKVVHPFS